MITINKKRTAIAACVVAMVSLSGCTTGQTGGQEGSTGTQAATDADATRLEAIASRHVNDAVAVVNKMKAEPRMAELLQQAKGVLIIPTYARAAFGVGARGGTGVLLVKRADGSWSGPAFFNIGGLSIGLQAGVEGGPIALVLNNDKAINQFMEKKNSFSLNADAGLTVVNWAKMVQGSTGGGDIVAWTGTRGLFGDVVAIGLNDIRYNQKLTSAYYHRTVSASDVIKGDVDNPQAEPLKHALGSGPAGTK
jgi:lipid-binding SYLF domain-containing protein